MMPGDILVYWMDRGEPIIRAYGVSDRIPCCMDTKISEANPKYWRQRISEETVAKDTERDTGSRNIRAKYTGGPYRYDYNYPSEVFSERRDRENKGAKCK
jgi:hypothetical protein